MMSYLTNIHHTSLIFMIMQIKPRLLINIHKSKGHRTLTSL